MTDVHARIHTFLQQQTVHSLRDNKPVQPDVFYNKAGVVPFTGDPRQFLVMKPKAKHAHLSPPAFQLCKGTRMQELNGSWKDLADKEPHLGTAETLAATALREGIEELGLALEGIKALYDIGPFCFFSSKSSTPHHMWLFAAELADEYALLPEETIADTTDARRWLTLQDFTAEGRDDHRTILADISARLEKY